ncbi:MAG: HesB/IscA family protein [Cytophagaceae bacterium]
MKPDLPPVSITEKALTEIQLIMRDKNIPAGYGLRIGVNGGGCSGVSYILGFDTAKASDDVYDYQGIALYMDKKHAMFVLGMIIDFEESAEARGFVFNNPS